MKKTVILSTLTIGLIGVVLLQYARLDNEQVQSSETNKISTSTQAAIKDTSLGQNKDSIKDVLPPELAGIVDVKDSTGNRDNSSGLTLAEQHEISEWDAQRGGSLEQQEIYRSYDKETIFALAKQGDIYALLEASNHLSSNSQTSKSLDVLRDAAARGSVEALSMLGLKYSGALTALMEGRRTEQEISEKYNVEFSNSHTMEKTLEILSASYYMTPALRGEVFGAFSDIDVFEKHDLKRKIAKEDWPIILKNANAIYAAINERREQMNLDAFDNSYPESYARFFGLPKENNMAEKFCEILEGDC